jgi:hypothetical protein
MSKPPPSGPHSDIDGVHQDGLTNAEATVQRSEDPADLKLPRGYGKGYSGAAVEKAEESS